MEMHIIPPVAILDCQRAAQVTANPILKLWIKSRTRLEALAILRSEAAPCNTFDCDQTCIDAKWAGAKGRGFSRLQGMDKTIKRGSREGGKTKRCTRHDFEVHWYVEVPDSMRDRWKGKI